MRESKRWKYSRTRSEREETATNKRAERKLDSLPKRKKMRD